MRLAAFVMLCCIIQCACVSDSTSCIEPPLYSSTTDSDTGGRITIDLERIDAKAITTIGWSEVVTRNFAQLSDENAALLLFLNAIDCYLSRGDIGMEVAKSMAESVREIWSARLGLKGSGQLVPLERESIERSAGNADRIFVRLKQFGIK